MSERRLKPGWKFWHFDQMAVNVKDSIARPVDSGLERYVGLEHLDTGSLKIWRWGSTSDVEKSKLLFRKGDIIFGRRNAYLRRVAVADFDGVCSAHALVLRANPDVVLPEFLPFFMQTDQFWEAALKVSAGSMSPTINWPNIAKEEFALPPLEEQRRISKLLLAVETVRQHVQDAVYQGWKSRVATYAHITQRGNAESSYKTSVIGEVPSCWEVMPVGEAVQIVNNLRKPISESDRSAIQGEYPYYGPTGQLDSLNEYRLDGTYALIGEDGDHFLKYAIWSMTQLIHGRNNVNNHAHVIRGTKYCSTEWFFHYFRHRDVRQWLTKQGSGRLKLKKKDLEQIPIAIPPLDIQLQLVDALGNTAAASERLNSRLNATGRLLEKIRNSSLGVS